MKPEQVMSYSHSMKVIGRPIAYYPNIAKALGDVNATIFLCQFLYWEGKQDEGSWIYKTQNDIYQETSLSRREQENARKKLRLTGILEEKLKGIPATIHYKFNWNKLDQIIASQYEHNSQSSMAETDILDWPKTPNYIYTETTSETTSEKKEKLIKKKSFEKKQRLPDDFVLSENMISYAKQKGFSEKETKEKFEHFKDYHLANASSFADWDAAFRTWVRNAISFSKSNISGFSNKNSTLPKKEAREIDPNDTVDIFSKF